MSLYQDTNKQAQWYKLIYSILGNQSTWVAAIGLTTGLFQAIADVGPEGINEPALAEKLGFAPRYVQVWCQAAYAFYLLDREEQTDSYRLAPHMDTLLLDLEEPLAMGNHIQFFSTLCKDFMAFPECLQTGESLQSEVHEPTHLELVKNMTKTDFKMITDIVLPQTGGTLEKLKQGGALLDIGTGAGFALVHYAKRFPKAQIVGLEFNEFIVEIAKRTIAEADLAERIKIQHGDANRLCYQNIYDLITMNLTLHETGGPSEYQNVLQRVYQALKPKGVAVISEFPCPDSVRDYRKNPVLQMMAAMQIHETMANNGMITKKELTKLLKETGFKNVRVAHQPIPARLVMLAEKKG